MREHRRLPTAHNTCEQDTLPSDLFTMHVCMPLEMLQGVMIRNAA